MNFDWLDKYQPYALAVLRIVVSLLFIEHGTQKLFGFPPMQMPGGAAAGADAMAPLMIGAGVLELAGGLAILVGFFTRPIALLLAGEMAVAYFLVHAPMSFFPVQNFGEAAVMFCFVFLYLVFVGPGAWSIDGLRARPAVTA